MSPCDTIQTSNVKFSLDNTSEALLIIAMDNMGYRQTGNLRFSDPVGNSVEFKNGNLQKRMVYGNQFDEGELKRQYSTEVVKHTAKKFGWKLTEKGKGKFEVLKGY
jgi:hypothetical protein